MTSQLSAIFANTAYLQQFNQRLPTIISVLLVIACAHALATITWMFLPETQSNAIQAQPASAPSIVPANQRQAIMQVANAHLFGKMERTALPQQTQAPKTKLNLVLRGVIAADPMTLSHAIIARGKKGNEEVYAIGEKMPGGITIEEIHADHVILNRSGRLETLQLIKDAELGSITTASTRRSFLPPGTPGEALAGVREQIMQNPTSFGEYALPVIVKERGKQIGYRLQPQQKGGELLQELGLEANDVITEINGIKLDNPQNGIGALRQLSTANSFSITVKRNGAEVPLNIQLK
jgi:general secretion pathway protein C